MKTKLALLLSIFLLIPAVLTCSAFAQTATRPKGIWAEVHKLSDAQLDQLRNDGYSFVFSKPVTTDLNRAQAHGLKAAVWLNGYKDGNDSPPICVWRSDDATVASQVDLVKNHPATAYYFVDDEPHANVGVCPDTPGQIAARNSLIKSHDPNHPTFITENRTADYAALANKTDILGLIGYPCNFNNLSSCSSSNIPGRVSAAQNAGVQHYWAIPQVFEELTTTGCDAYYRYPTSSQYATLINQWRASREEGEFAFMGNRVFSCGKGLLENPTLETTVSQYNH